MNRPNPVAAATVSVTTRTAPCGSGELTSPESTAERNLIRAPGIWVATTADSRASLIDDPVTSTMLAAARLPRPASPCCGMIRKAPPAGWAGVLAACPTIRTLIWPGVYSDLILATAWPRLAAAAGEASTGTVVAGDSGPPEATLIAGTGTAGNGVPATTAW